MILIQWCKYNGIFQNNKITIEINHNLFLHLHTYRPDNHTQPATQIPTLLLQLNENRMIDVIRHRLINRPRIYSHTIQPRVYITRYTTGTIQAIFIHNQFAVKQGIAYTYCIIRQYLPKVQLLVRR